jgi:drug/metabolite transporter (DMT)-like permease
MSAFAPGKTDAAAENPLAFGTLLAVLGAVCFGVVTPFIQRFGRGVGPFTTAGTLYLGAALGALRGSRGERASLEPSVRWTHLPRLLLVALFGAALAPTLFAWGLQRVPATYAALLLNGEAVFTLALAALVYREHVGGRVAVAASLIGAGGAAAVAGASEDATGGILGSAAVIAAVFCWALDNVLTRSLADLDPAGVVRGKALLGAALTFGAAWRQGESAPSPMALLGLLACGATGYGLSLRLYLLAQRRIGAGRTGSVFALAPFLGAASAAALGDRSAGWPLALAGGFFAAGVWLHLTESHDHDHAHQAMEHDHAHRHDDGHHDHVHVVAPEGGHSHPHRHDARIHAHPHGPDSHHGHNH